jgi:hypothetical protein
VRCGRKWTGSRGRWSSPKGINGGGGLAKPDEVELFPLPRTEEEDVGRRLSPVGSSRWTIGSREGELKRGVDGLLSMQGGKGGVGVRPGEKLVQRPRRATCHAAMEGTQRRRRRVVHDRRGIGEKRGRVGGPPL